MYIFEFIQICVRVGGGLYLCKVVEVHYTLIETVFNSIHITHS